MVLKGIIPMLLDLIIDPECVSADPACMTLSNISRVSSLTQKVMDHLQDSNIPIDKLINAFTKVNYNTKGCKLHYLGPIFSNLSQSSEFRRYFKIISKLCIFY